MTGAPLSPLALLTLRAGALAGLLLLPAPRQSSHLLHPGRSEASVLTLIRWSKAVLLRGAPVGGENRHRWPSYAPSGWPQAERAMQL
jgi:hypothetical protein